MPRVVADANVLVSAALARSPQAPSVLTLDAALDGRVELVTSPLLLREVTIVLARPRLQKYVSSDEAARFVADLAAQSVLLVDPPGPHPAVCRDPRDDYLVALAEASGAEAIISGAGADARGSLQQTLHPHPGASWPGGRRWSTLDLEVGCLACVHPRGPRTYPSATVLP
jgi:putative PIN family toxin of toxin-antitoxin system